MFNNTLNLIHVTLGCFFLRYRSEIKKLPFPDKFLGYCINTATLKLNQETRAFNIFIATRGPIPVP
jgi:hypothetical protein